MKKGALRRENVASVPPVSSPIALDSVRPWLLVHLLYCAKVVVSFRGLHSDNLSFCQWLQWMT